MTTVSGSGTCSSNDEAKLIDVSREPDNYLHLIQFDIVPIQILIFICS